MSRGRSSFAWLLAGAPLGFAALADVVAGLSLVAWTALVFGALAGVPGRPAPPLPAAGLFVAQALPLLIAAAVLDARGGFPHGARLVVVGLASGALLRAAGARGGRGYELAWGAIVLGIPLLAAVVAWDGARGGAPAGLQLLAQASPLTRFHAALSTGATGAAAAAAALLTPLALGALALWGPARRAPAQPAGRKRAR